jgi:hypothetical protein
MAGGDAPAAVGHKPDPIHHARLLGEGAAQRGQKTKICDYVGLTRFRADVATAAVRVASCSMDIYMAHLSVRSINQTWPGAPDKRR